MIVGLSIGIALALVAGLILGFFIAKHLFQKQMKKNPPINEQQIRMMYMQMGRKPTEAQIKAIMSSFKK